MGILRLRNGSIGPALARLAAAHFKLPPFAQYGGGAGGPTAAASAATASDDDVEDDDDDDEVNEPDFWCKLLHDCSVDAFVLTTIALSYEVDTRYGPTVVMQDITEARRFADTVVRSPLLEVVAGCVTSAAKARFRTAAAANTGSRLLHGASQLIVSLCTAINNALEAERVMKIPAAPPTEFVTALRDTGLMQGCARLLVAVAEGVRAGGAGISFAHRQGIAAGTMMYLEAFRGTQEATRPRSAAERAVAGPDSERAILALGLAALRLLDGGSGGDSGSGGAPALGLALPLLNSAATVVTFEAPVSDECSPGEASRVSTSIPGALANLPHAVVMGVAAGRFEADAAMDVVLRTARVGVAAMRKLPPSPAAAAAGKAGGSTSTVAGAATRAARGNSRLRLSSEEGMRVAAAALTAGWRLAGDGGLGLQEAVSELWRLHVEVVAAVPTTGEVTRQHAHLGNLLFTRFSRIDMKDPQPSPPDDVAVPLSAGLLPALERMLRRAGEAPDGPQTVMLRGLVDALISDSDPASLGAPLSSVTSLLPRGVLRYSSWDFLAPLLAYGDRRQAAALVQSMPKVLRGLADSTAGSSAKVYVTGLAADFLRASGTALSKPVDGIVLMPFANQGRQDPQAAAVSRQLSGMALLAAREWLPALERLMAQRLCDPNCSCGAEDRVILLAREAACVWLVLAAAAATDSSSSSSSSAGGGSSAATSAHGLLRGVDLWGLVQRVLEPRASFTPGVRSVGAPPRIAALACVSLAAAFPEGLRAATVGHAGGIGSGGGSPPMPPAVLGELASDFQSTGHRGLADALRALKAQVEAWAAGSQTKDPACLAKLRSAASAPGGGSRDALELLQAAEHGGEAEGLGRGCGFPGCTHLAGDSLLELRLKKCSRCGMRYCGEECQRAHWAAGHKKECSASARTAVV